MSNLPVKPKTNVLTQVEEGAKSLGVIGAIQAVQRETKALAEQARALSEEVHAARQREARSAVEELIGSFLVVWDVLPEAQKTVSVSLSFKERALRAVTGKSGRKVTGRILDVPMGESDQAPGVFLDQD